MEFHHHHYFHAADSDPRIDQVLNLLTKLTAKEDKMAIDVTKLVADVAAERTVIDGAITLLNGQTATLIDLKTQLAAAIAANDPAAMQAVQDALDKAATDLESQKTDLANAIVANTPAAPAA